MLQDCFQQKMNPTAKTCSESQGASQDEEPKESMREYREFMFKIAEKSSIAPLSPAAMARFQGRLNEFISEYETPEHPTYHVMIQRAIRELNHKGGSSEESIMHFLEKEYKQLPLANSALVKHHLGKLRESGDIVLNHAKRYMLGVAKPDPNPCSIRRSEPSIASQCKLEQVRKMEGQNRCTEKDDKRRGSDVQEQRFNGNGVDVREKQVDEYQAMGLHKQQEQLPVHGRLPGFQSMRIENRSHQEQGNAVKEKGLPSRNKAKKHVTTVISKDERVAKALKSGQATEGHQLTGYALRIMASTHPPEFEAVMNSRPSSPRTPINWDKPPIEPHMMLGMRRRWARTKDVLHFPVEDVYPQISQDQP